LAGTEIGFGVLTVHGQLTTAFLYNDYGLVQGKGRIDAPLGVANWGGVVAPGGLFKVGTLTIGGDFSQSNAGTLAFEIKRQKNDLLIVEGDAALDGTLAVLPLNRLRFGDEFTLIEADAILGDFEHVVGFGTALYGRTEIVGGDLNFIIEAERFTDLISESSPLFDLAEALDGARDDFFDDLDDVFDLVDNTSLALLEPVFQTLTPRTDLFQAPLAARSYSLNFQQRIDARAAELRAGATGVSMAGPLNGYRAAARPSSGRSLAQSHAPVPRQRDTGFGVFIAGDATPQRDYRPNALADESPGNMPVSLTSQGNMTIGMDYRVAPNFAFGIASTVSRFDIRQTDHQPLETVSFGVAAYATYFGRNWYVDGLYGAARQHTDVERVLVGFEDVNRFADSSSAATQTFAAVKSGWTFEPAKGLTVGPTATLTYSSLHMSGYKEVNAGAFNLIVDGRTIRSMTVKSGLEFSFEHLFAGNRRFNAYGRIGAVRNFGDSRDVVTAAFAAAPDLRFDIDRQIDRSWYSAGGGISYLVAGKVRAHLEMSSEFDRQNLNYHTARAGLTVAF
ncbi:MAG: autotransporter outer membrane beta-barrel domain-containing protein, partial [Sphingomonadales bacterium]|nr:autotransporter outer membrane beta-barrel domain-containing protein [Sphingomonadales bacterium]